MKLEDQMIEAGLGELRRQAEAAGAVAGRP